MDTNVKRREWVKTVAIIFLAVLLVLTFFSNTIMNASLPEVATQQVTQGTINAKIRASGTIAANETYNVKLTQTRKIESVKCKVGQEVNAGDVLFVLEAQESDELKQAKTDLETLELNYMPYAMSVIVSRAIPEIDGFKPSHRKLLPTAPRRKTATSRSSGTRITRRSPSTANTAPWTRARFPLKRRRQKSGSTS